MKKILILISFTLFSVYSFSQSYTCFPTPCKPFQNTDLWQIYGALSNGSASTTVINGNVGGFTGKYLVTIPTDGVYSVGDNVGTINTVSNCFRLNQGSGLLKDLEIWDLYNQQAGLVVDFWRASPGGTFLNNSPVVYSAGSDFALYIGSVVILPSDYVVIGGVAKVCLTNIDLTLIGGVVGTSRDLYITVATTGTPNYGGNGTLYLRIGLDLD